MAGQIIKRGEDTWQIRVFLGRDGNGKRKYFSQTIHGTKRLAQRELTKQLGKRDAGELLSTAPIFLKDHLASWLDKKVKKKVKESTFDGYKWVVDTYLIPGLGMHRLSDLQSRYSIIQDFYDSLTLRGLSARTVRYTHSVLSPALRSAIEDGHLVRNPCDRCSLPRKDAAEMKYFTADEVKAFLGAAKTDRLYPLFLLAIECGLRPGEYLGLQWKDLDLEAKTLSVRRVAKARKGGGYYFTTPKTKGSLRLIPISTRLATELKAYRRTQAEYIMKHRDIYQDIDLVFANEEGRPMLRENVNVRHFSKIVEAAGVPKIRLYDLRHTMATLLLMAGVHPKIVSERLGHSSIVLTMDTYSHVLPTMQEDATGSLERLMAG
jgi:integrase